jgi:aspartokinase-like uncharacterized kinase
MTSAWLMPPIVVKVSGSLYDWPELGMRLHEFLATYPEHHAVLVPGGGSFVDAVRAADKAHGLGDETAHWLALHALTLAGQFLANLLPDARVVEGLNAARSVWKRGSVTILDMYRFARGDESRPDHLPHTWDTTSDSLAARVARVAPAQRLVLLKSADPPANWQSSGDYVDPLFAKTLAGAKFPVEPINLRTWKAA